MRLYCSLCLLLVASLLGPGAPASTIVAVRTPSGVAIAADSLGTFPSIHSKIGFRTVCKLYRVDQSVFSIAGIASDPRHGYNPAATIASILRSSQDPYQVRARLEIEFKEALVHEMKVMRREESKLFLDAIAEGQGTTILLAFYWAREPHLIGVSLIPILDCSGAIGIKTSSYHCPGQCKDGVLVLKAGRAEAINAYIAANGLSMAPVQAVDFLVGLEIAAHTHGVGPPVDVVEVSTSGVSCYRCKSGCPCNLLEFE